METEDEWTFRTRKRKTGLGWRITFERSKGAGQAAQWASVKGLGHRKPQEGSGGYLLHAKGACSLANAFHLT